MQTIAKILENATVRLDSPEYPTKRELLQYLYEQNQFYVNDLRLTDQGWLLRQYPFPVDGSTDTYPVPAAGFSGAYLVTTDPSAYVDGRRREVQTLRLTDFNLVQTPDLLQTTGAVEQDTVAAIAFYQQDGQWWGKVKPSNGQGTYTIWYEPGAVLDGNIDNAPDLMQQFAQLLTVATACDALPTCRWAGLDGEAAAAKRTVLGARLGQLEARFYQQFRTYIRTVNQPQTEFRQPYETSLGMARRANRFGGRFGGW